MKVIRCYQFYITNEDRAQSHTESISLIVSHFRYKNKLHIGQIQCTRNNINQLIN